MQHVHQAYEHELVLLILPYCNDVNFRNVSEKAWTLLSNYSISHALFTEMKNLQKCKCDRYNCSIFYCNGSVSKHMLRAMWFHCLSLINWLTKWLTDWCIRWLIKWYQLPCSTGYCLQAIKWQTEACYWDSMPCSYNGQLGIIYMHYLIDMITHGTAFDTARRCQ